MMAGVLLLVSGCTVQYTMSGASISPEVETVSVAYFTNQASIVKPSLSQNLTDALKDKIQQNTRLTLVTEGGDVSFEGEISQYDSEPISIGANERAAENRLTMVLRVKYTNNVEPDLSFDKRFSRHEDYESSQTLSQVEDELNELILDQLVQDIFEEAFVNW